MGIILLNLRRRLAVLPLNACCHPPCLVILTPTPLLALSLSLSLSYSRSHLPPPPSPQRFASPASAGVEATNPHWIGSFYNTRPSPAPLQSILAPSPRRIIIVNPDLVGSCGSSAPSCGHLPPRHHVRSQSRPRASGQALPAAQHHS